jgi:formylmethanofuran dehydrogenase subunit E-like metal-binding protein
MDKRRAVGNKVAYGIMACIVFVFIACPVCYGLEPGVSDPDAGYAKWEMIGRLAAEESRTLLKKAGASPEKGDIIVLTNAGYAEVNGDSTQGALDGLSGITGSSRGRQTLVEIHSAPWEKLWFALYDKESGLCSYLEVNPSVTEYSSAELFDIRALEKISFEYLRNHPDKYAAKFQEKMFGGNEFRVISIVNAIAEGAPPYAVRAFEFHDHFCPGVTSGIIMAEYLKRHFPLGPEDECFVQAVNPWCKEDALMVLLNATPGKGAYAVNYPSDSDLKRLLPELKDASTIFYMKAKNTGRWKGVVLAFEWADTGCAETGNGLIDKICVDLWYVRQFGNPERFVKVIKSFELPEGVEPEDYARPGIDPMKELGLTLPLHGE